MLTCPDCGQDNADSLSFCDRCGASLAVAPTDDLDGYPTPVEPGTVIEGKYEILTEIERGGMGVVYRGHDVTLNRKVAIKVLPEHFNANPDVVARFKREARALASLDHPNIVPVYAIGQHERCYYFAMKYLEGRTVADELKVMRDRGGPFFDEHAVVHVLTEVARGLGHAHRRGLVHRDIKPSNIMVGPDRHITIMDLGIVKQQGGGTPLTRAGVVFGTPEYMAPEQAQGQSAPDPTTDFYALGIVAYEMLVGEPPFHGPTPIEVVLRHIQEEPVPIDRRRPDVNPELQSIIFRMIAKAPQARFQTAEEVLAALGAVALGPAPAIRGRRSVSIAPDPELDASLDAPLGGSLARLSDRPALIPPPAEGLPAPGRRPPERPRPEPERLEDNPLSLSASGIRPGRYERLGPRPEAEPTAPHPVARRRLPAAAIVAGVAVLAIALIIALTRHAPPVADLGVDLGPVDALVPDAAPPAPDAAPPPPLPAVAVQLHLKSEPGEATIYSPHDLETPLGTTPILMLQPENMMTRDLVLKKPGYHDLRVTVSFMANREYVFQLVPEGEPPQ
ncbi:MAG: protein kinase [bacterium]